MPFKKSTVPELKVLKGFFNLKIYSYEIHFNMAILRDIKKPNNKTLLLFN